MKHSRYQPCHKSNNDGPNNTHRVPPIREALIVPDSQRLLQIGGGRRSAAKLLTKDGERL
jgi:hypothetical protein